MNQPLSRYKKTKDGRLIIDISISKYAELYAEWDNTASYLKKDLDTDLADFLYECFEESKKSKYVIRIKSPNPDNSNQKKIKKSINTYFDYMAQKEVIKLKKELSSNLRHFFLGLFFIVSSILIPSLSFNELARDVIEEGMVLLGWVTLWKVFSSILYEMHVIYSDYKIYKRISETEVVFI